MKSPDGATTRNDRTALQQLEYWKKVQNEWCEHKPSITVTVREYEWPTVGGWVWDNFDCISGISFLPHSEHTYRQAPYQECTEGEYEALKAKMPIEIRWDDLSHYELEDTTTGMSTIACSADGCEIVDI
jgi:ribonucleoside-diphosphate reductase alpha chain